MDEPISRSPAPPPAQKTIWLGPLALVGVSVVLTTVVTVAGLLLLLDAPQVEVQLDIIKTGLAAGAGAGALVTLLYTARGHLLAEDVARDARLDASEKRIIELYTKGIEQFGADPVQVRVGGLYALERLARGTPDLREQVIDVVCSQLRTLDDGAPSADRQSLILGRAIREFLIDHLAYDSPHMIHKDYWDVPHIELSDARLARLYFGAVRVHTIHFQKTVFSAAQFGSTANFDNVRFAYEVDFTDARFSEPPSFVGARIRIDHTGRVHLPAEWTVVPPATSREATLPDQEGIWGSIRKINDLV